MARIEIVYTNGKSNVIEVEPYNIYETIDAIQSDVEGIWHNAKKIEVFLYEADIQRWHSGFVKRNNKWIELTDPFTQPLRLAKQLGVSVSCAV